MVDVLPVDGSDPIENYHKVENELKKYSEALYKKPRWLVLNKIDQLPQDEVDVSIFCKVLVGIKMSLTSLFPE